MSITITIPVEHPAHMLLAVQSNMTAYGRTVLADFVKANTGKNLRDYTRFPQDVRLNRFFGTKIAAEQYREKLRYELQCYKEEQRYPKLAHIVQYMFLWRKYSMAVLCQAYPQQFEKEFISYYTEKLLLKRNADVEASFIKDMVVFKEYMKVQDAKGQAVDIKELGKYMGAAEKIYIRLVKDFSIIAAPGIYPGKYTAQEVADFIAEFMTEYFDVSQPEYDDIYTAFLQEMVACGLDRFRYNEATENRGEDAP